MTKDEERRLAGIASGHPCRAFAASEARARAMDWSDLTRGCWRLMSVPEGSWRDESVVGRVMLGEKHAACVVVG